ncbi:MAG: CDP-archaeol synthase [candidate division KSB1 bacterium]|nr:CDP-archaeol synthase [candidate division KSB1 bacterium]
MDALESLFKTLLSTFILFAPGMFANTLAGLSRYIKPLTPLGFPVDGGLTFRGKPLLGQNKTFRGLLAGTLMGGLLGIVCTSFGIGLLQGFGALLGDALGSFIKRQLNYAPGQRFPVLDQIDYVPTLLLATALFVPVTWGQVVCLFFLATVGQISFSYFGYKLGLKDVPY